MQSTFCSCNSLSFNVCALWLHQNDNILQSHQCKSKVTQRNISNMKISASFFFDPSVLSQWSSCRYRWHQGVGNGMANTKFTKSAYFCIDHLIFDHCFVFCSKNLLILDNLDNETSKIAFLKRCESAAKQLFDSL